MYGIDDLIDEFSIDRDALERQKQRMRAEIEAYELSEIRKRAGLTQTQIAANMGVSQKRISEIERGRAESIKLGTLQRYAAALGGRLKVEIECPTPDGGTRVLGVPLSA